MLSKVFKAYDVRGTYPKELDETLAEQIGIAAGRHLKSQVDGRQASDPMMNHVVVGRDMRKSAPDMAEALMKGLANGPVDVIDVGRVDTSFIYFAINHLGTCGGIMTTASHNPPQYIGFKFSGQKAVPIGSASGLSDIQRATAAVDLLKDRAEKPGRIVQRDLWDDYKTHVRRFLDLDRKLKVVVDCSNGMAGVFLGPLFGDVDNLELIVLNAETTGEFAHDPNPLVKENMRMTQDAVREHGADLGVCFDGDADRCAFVDETGELIGADLLGARMAEHFLNFTPGSPIVYDLRASKALPEHIEQCGGKPIRSRVGHVFMKSLMKENDAVFGAELSAHLYYRDNWYADSGAITFATVLSILCEHGRPMSELLQPLRRYHQSGELNFNVEDKQGMMDQLAEAYGDQAKVDHLDGVTIDAFDKAGWWFNVRASNTEPLLRLNLEAKDEATRDRMLDELQSELGTPVAGH